MIASMHNPLCNAMSLEMSKLSGHNGCVWQPSTSHMLIASAEWYPSLKQVIYCTGENALLPNYVD